MANELWNALEAQRSRLEQHRENSARHASLYMTFVTTGAGVTNLGEVQWFDTPFIEEPIVTTGAVVRQPPDLSIYQLPRVTAGVLRWERGERGFFRGVYLYFVVDCPPIEPDGDLGMAPPSAIVVHHMAFAGISYKELGSGVDDGLDDHLDPLTPPIVP